MKKGKYKQITITIPRALAEALNITKTTRLGFRIAGQNRLEMVIQNGK